jgi:hypothetical protein
MNRVLAAIFAALIAVVLLSGTAYYVGLFVPFVVHMSAHAGRAATHAGSAVAMMVSLGSMYFCIWIAMRHRPRDQERRAAPKRLRP